MFVKLTNSSDGLEGTSIGINTSIILSVFQSRHEGTGELRTYIYAGDKGTWEVQEDINTVIELLNK